MKKQVVFQTEKGLECAAFLPQQNLVLNDKEYHSGDLIGFDHEGGVVEFVNNQGAEAEFILFGGEKYTEPYVAQGPFVMNTQAEIYQAHADYQSGKYGEITYN